MPSDIVALIVLFAFVRSLIIIFSPPTGRRERAQKIAKVTANRLVIVAVFGLAANYWMDMSLRSKAHDCEKMLSDNGGRYTAELCLLKRNSGDNSDYLGRVYDAKDGELLVERTFSTPVPELSWFKGQVSFERGGDGSSDVTLPLMLYDRILAKLP